MGYTTSTVHGIEVPDGAEANNVPEDIGKVVTALEGGSIVKRLTGAQIAALTSPQKPAGLLVYNTTTGMYQRSDGTNFRDLGPFPYAELVRSSNQVIPASTWTKVTYGSSTDPSSIGSTGGGTITLAAGAWALSFSGAMDTVFLSATASIYVNGALRGLSGISDIVGAHLALHASTLVLVSSSVTAEARVFHNGGGSQNLAAAQFTAVRIA